MSTLNLLIYPFLSSIWILSKDIINSFTSTASVFTGTAGKVPGFAGNGLQKPVNLGKPAFFDNGVTSERFGTSNQPFTTARADLSTATNTMYPYRASG
jgi:hypothetical protein